MRRYTTWLLAFVCFLTLLAAPLIISDQSSNAVLQGSAVLAASADSFTLSSTVALLHSPRVNLESGTLSLPATRSGLARGGEVIAMLITGSSPQLMLRDAVLSVDFSGTSPTVGHDLSSGEVAPLVDALQKMQFDGLQVRDSTIQIKLSDGTVLALDNLTAAVSSKQNGALRATGTFVFHGETVNFDTMLNPSLSAQGMSRPLKATFTSAPLSATLDGSLLLGENPQFLSSSSELKTPDVRAAARWLGIDWPAGDGFGPLQINGQLEWAARTIAFQNATVSLDDNTATGTVSINLETPKPSLEGTLGLKTLNLSRYLPGLDASEQRPLLTTPNELSAADYPLIRAIDTDLRLSADRVTLPGMTLGRSAATVTSNNGRMLADIAELEIDDGSRASGQLRIDVSGARPAYGFNAKIEAPDVGRSINAMFGHPAVQGRGTITVDLTTADIPADNLLHALQGKLYVTLADAGRVGFDVNRLTAADQPNTPAAWQEISARAVTVDKLDARFTLANAILRTQSVEAISGQSALTVDGKIDLAEEQLDLRLTVGDIVNKDAAAGTGALEIKKRDIIDLRGPWKAPTVRAMPAHAETQEHGPPSPG